jgi:pimeloyl-ACP methyl ester carboxylesterase
MMPRRSLAAILFTLALSACSTGGGQTPSGFLGSRASEAATTPASTRSPTAPSSEVTTSEVSTEMTRTITVWQPPGEGPFPIVYALHGHGAWRRDLSVIAEGLARGGALVFAADYRSSEALDVMVQDVECGYRYALSIADRYGGSLDLPITMIGHSQGASVILVHGLREAEFGPGGTYRACFAGARRPDVIVPIAGCHYGLGDATWDFDTSGFTNNEAHILLVAGTRDEECSAWQSHDAADALHALGYDASVAEIDGADHLTLISETEANGAVVPNPDEPAGAEVIQVILAAIHAAEN